MHPYNQLPVIPFDVYIQATNQVSLGASIHQLPVIPFDVYIQATNQVLGGESHYFALQEQFTGPGSQLKGPACISFGDG